MSQDSDDLRGLVERVHAGLRATEALIREGYEGRTALATTLAATLAKVGSLEEDMRRLMRVIDGGNGESLMAKFAVLKDNVERLERTQSQQRSRGWDLVLWVLPLLVAFFLYALPMVLKAQLEAVP